MIDQRFFLSMLCCVAFTFGAAGQNWEFVKEKEGIKIYTCQEEGKSLKSYRGIADVNAPAEKVFALIEDVTNTEWWDKNLSQIKVLQYEKNKMAQYYLVYDLPWPVTDRDLCAQAKVTFNPETREGSIITTSLPSLLPETEDKIRIKYFRQSWTISPAGKEKSHVVLEGFVDPAGSIPDWVINMLVVSSPYNVIEGVKKGLEK